MISEKIELKAEEILQTMGIKNIPIPIEEIASKLQIKISRAPSKDFSGLLIRKDGHALIGINNSEAPVRQRFTVAHELGHFFLHPQKDTFVDYRDNKKDLMKTNKEKQANMFAAALLMPRKNVEKDFRNVARASLSDEETQKILADRYDVSEEAMRFRLKNLGLQILT